MKLWTSTTCSIHNVAPEIKDYESHGWRFHSFSCSRFGATLLFWQVKKEPVKVYPTLDELLTNERPGGFDGPTGAD